MVYAITQKSANDPNSAAFFSGVSLACGCVCGKKAIAHTHIMPIQGSPGRCETVASKTESYECDFMGDRWCEVEETTKWAMTGGGAGECAQVPFTISRPVSAYTPKENFAGLRSV